MSSSAAAIAEACPDELLRVALRRWIMDCHEARRERDVAQAALAKALEVLSAARDALAEGGREDTVVKKM